MVKTRVWHNPLVKSLLSDHHSIKVTLVLTTSHPHDALAHVWFDIIFCWTPLCFTSMTVWVERLAVGRTTVTIEGQSPGYSCMFCQLHLLHSQLNSLSHQALVPLLRSSGYYSHSRHHHGMVCVIVGK